MCSAVNRHKLVIQRPVLEQMGRVHFEEFRVMVPKLQFSADWKQLALDSKPALQQFRFRYRNGLLTCDGDIEVVRIDRNESHANPWPAAPYIDTCAARSSWLKSDAVDDRRDNNIECNGHEGGLLGLTKHVLPERTMKGGIASGCTRRIVRNFEKPPKQSVMVVLKDYAFVSTDNSRKVTVVQAACVRVQRT